MASEDGLAHTLTAPSAPNPGTAPLTALGRFQIERTLGTGGMGVVYAAFDPQLERRVALKVIKHATGDARARFLREARAMAKLSHPHVITVFETGTADGRDFVAMELIDGETLNDWVRRTRPRWRTTLAALIAAGEGLAAAHAAGLVHRDFKPHNVLRSFAGKIVVTDFGLALAAAGAPDPAHDVGSSTAIEATATGALVGTPAYMAPEQWTASEVGSAADQFAFCVTLWEALTGARPFRGAMIHDIEAATLRGPAALDDHAIPRALRPILRRGLALDPAARWPDMPRLLRALERVSRRRARLVVGGTTVLAVAAIAATMLIAGRPAAAGCPDPWLDPSAMWSAERSTALASRGADAAQLLDDDAASWRAQRAAACMAPPERRSARLACLDAVQARFAALAHDAETDRGPIDADGLARGLVDPAVCGGAAPPTLSSTTPELTSAFRALRHAVARDDDAPATSPAAGSPCVRVLGLLAQLERPGASPVETAAIDQLAPTCTDDHIRTLAAVATVDDTDPASIDRGGAIATAFGQLDLAARIDEARASFAISQFAWDLALMQIDAALAAFTQRHEIRAQISMIQRRVVVQLQRADAGDREQALARLDRWIPITRSVDPRQAPVLEELRVRARWSLGDIAGADASCDQLRARGLIREPIAASSELVAISGIVVDSAGAPVAGASVTAGVPLFADSARLGGCFEGHGATTTTGADGRFSLRAARGSIAAMQGDLRSNPIATGTNLRLVLAPTSRIAGRIERDPRVTGDARLVAYQDAPGRYRAMAPIAPDGRFVLEGVPRTRIELAVIANSTGMVPIQSLEVDRPVIEDLRLTSVAARKLAVIARSETEATTRGALIITAPLPAHPGATLAQLLTLGGVSAFETASHADPSTVDPALRPHLVADDLVAAIPRPGVEVRVCAIGVSRTLRADAPPAEIVRILGSEVPGCVTAQPTDPFVIVPIPAVRRR